MEKQRSQVFDFGDFRIDLHAGRLERRDGAAVALRPRVFETLRCLIENGGRILGKEEIMRAVWPDCVVEENNLAQNISILRRAFEDTAEDRRYIATVPGRGYRFLAAVTRVDSVAAELEKEETAAACDDLPTGGDHRNDLLPVHAFEPGFRRWWKRPLVFATLVISLSVTALFWWQLTRPPELRESIAVLPFENLSSETENAFFADGVQDEILTRLAKVADLKVISRTSVVAYRQKAGRDLIAIGRELGVAHLLEGSVQRVAGRVRVTAQLISTKTGAHEWAETYDRDLLDVFTIQSEIATAIAQELAAEISPRERATFAETRTTDLKADALYQEAREISVVQPIEATNQVVRLLEEAISRDSQFILAYCFLGRLHTRLYFTRQDYTAARLDRARRAIETAAQLRPESGEVHLALAHYAFYGLRDYDRARAQLELARRVMPNGADVYFLSALLDRRQGRWNEASRNIERACELDPRNLEYVIVAGRTALGMRLYSEANHYFERALSHPQGENSAAQLLRARNLFCQGAALRPLAKLLAQRMVAGSTDKEGLALDLLEYALAQRDEAAASRALALLPDDVSATGHDGSPRDLLAAMSARAFNEPETARALFLSARAKIEAFAQSNPDYSPALSVLARIDAALGRKEDALREGRRACELLPLSEDALNGATLITDLAITYAWSGEKDLALEQLAISARIPMGVSYGELKLNPEWDSLRGDHRFENIVASLAP